MSLGASCSRVVRVSPRVVRGFRCVHRSPRILPRRRIRAPSRGRPFTKMGDSLPLERWELTMLLLVGHNPLHGVMKLMLDHELIELDSIKGPSVPARKIEQETCR